jgi:hypothetical protein
VTGFAGTVWHLMFAGADPLAPARAPVGRFHHSGQWALYTSLTREGCAVAIQRYLTASDAPRVLAPLDLQAERVADLRGDASASLIWQDIQARGAAAPTWARSDRARAAGAQVLLYSSRSRPELAHLVLFDLSVVRSVGPPQPWP